MTAAAVIVGSAAALVGAGTFSVFNDTATGSGTLKTGTVALSLSGAKTASLPVNPTCTLPFTSAIGQRDNLGTANNTDCTASVSVSNAGSLPFTLAGSGTQVTDSLVGGVSCWTSTITDGATTGQVVLPGASQVVKLKTANTNDAAVCQGKTDNVTLSLTATEALPAAVQAPPAETEPLALDGRFTLGVTFSPTDGTALDCGYPDVAVTYTDGTTGTLTLFNGGPPDNGRYYLGNGNRYISSYSCWVASQSPVNTAYRSYLSYNLAQLSASKTVASAVLRLNMTTAQMSSGNTAGTLSLWSVGTPYSTVRSNVVGANWQSIFDDLGDGTSYGQANNVTVGQLPLPLSPAAVQDLNTELHSLG